MTLDAARITVERTSVVGCEPRFFCNESVGGEGHPIGPTGKLVVGVGPPLAGARLD